jgi:hypothetical protein
MNCDVCGYNLTDDSGRANVAVEIKLLGASFERKRVEEVFGKNEFSICYVCRLKSLGVKTRQPA